MFCSSQVLLLQHNEIIIFDIISLMGSEYRKKRENAPPVISEQENDALRVLAQIIARRHIRNQLNKIEGSTNENITDDDSNSNTSKG